jgi:hypothetical protein
MNRLERGLARLRDMRFDLYAQPMRQVSLELQIVFFAIHLPVAGGVTLRVPMITVIKPMPNSSKQLPASDGAHGGTPGP